MRMGKAILATAAAVSLVASPALAGAEKLAVSASTQNYQDVSANTDAQHASQGASTVVISILALSALIGGVVAATSNSSSTPTSP